MELPPYRMPSLSSLLKNSWEKCKGFIIKAGTVIFAMSVVIWLLQNFDMSLRMTDDGTKSIFAQIGRFIAPVFAPLGFGNWESSAAILSGVVAKEAVVTTFGVLLSVQGGTALNAALTQMFTPLSAFSFMLFTLLYIPCISAFFTIRKEMGSAKWAFASAAIQMGSAYLAALAFYQIGTFLS